MGSHILYGVVHAIQLSKIAPAEKTSIQPQTGNVKPYFSKLLPSGTMPTPGADWMMSIVNHNSHVKNYRKRHSPNNCQTPAESGYRITTSASMPTLLRHQT